MGNGQPLSEDAFAYGSKTETCQFLTSFLASPTKMNGNMPTCLCPITDRVRFRLFPSTVWIGREYGLDWFRVRFRYPLVTDRRRDSQELCRLKHSATLGLAWQGW